MIELAYINKYLFEVDEELEEVARKYYDFNILHTDYWRLRHICCLNKYPDKIIGFFYKLGRNLKNAKYKIFRFICKHKIMITKQGCIMRFTDIKPLCYFLKK